MIKKHSCGAILYTFYKGQIYIILGEEHGDWFAFKGTREKNESNEQAAIREINEETCGLLTPKKIKLDCMFSTKRKIYHIGLVKINMDFIDEFYSVRKLCTRPEMLEKTNVRAFPITYDFNKFHKITRHPINYYLNYLKSHMRTYIYKSIGKVNMQGVDKNKHPVRTMFKNMQINIENKNRRVYYGFPVQPAVNQYLRLKNHDRLNKYDKWNRNTHIFNQAGYGLTIVF
jgi:8-oxo-dGTP pyrophosphatase MutT (NUDIX family)